jgi:hypothetical protein
MTLCGRWLTRYLEGGEEVWQTMTHFAAEKLLCRQWRADDNMAVTLDEQFAVMSRRLVLDFNTRICSGERRRTAEANQMNQVEKHMRVCLGVLEGFESAVTVASSEPILTEAAALIMQHPTFSSCRALQQILEWPGMSKGDRGELIVCNITIDTLDKLMFRSSPAPSLVVKVTSYFEQLFAAGVYDTTIRDMMPSELHPEREAKTFAETFKDARLYVTHFIKVYDSSIISVDNLEKFIARGAAILCAENHSGIDAVIPYIYYDHFLKKENLSVILKQSKNDLKISAPSRFLFSAMHPVKLRVFDRNQANPPPVIRMIYALAARHPGVYAMEASQRPSLSRKAKHSAANFTSFDIWCGQASSSTFGAIESKDDEMYKALLKRSLQVTDMFKSTHEYIEEVTRSMYPLAASKPGHWKAFCEPKTRAAAVDDSDSDGTTGEWGPESSDPAQKGHRNDTTKAVSSM